MATTEVATTAAPATHPSRNTRHAIDLAGPAFATPAGAISLLVAVRKFVPTGETDTLAQIVRVIALAFPDNLAVIHTAGVTMREAGCVDDAVAYFKCAFSLDSSFAYSALEMADIAGASGKFEEARYWYGVAMYGDPFLARAYFLAARFELSIGKKQRAIVLLERARRLGSSMPEIRDMLSQLTT